MLSASRGSGLRRRRIHLIGEDVLLVGLGDCSVEPHQQLRERFAFPAHQHGKGVVAVAGDGNTPNRVEPTDDDLPFPACELLDVGQVQRGLGTGARRKPWRTSRRLAQFALQAYCDVPRQQFLDAIDGVLGNARKHVAQIRLAGPCR